MPVREKLSGLTKSYSNNFNRNKAQNNQLFMIIIENQENSLNRRKCLKGKAVIGFVFVLNPYT